MKPITAGAIGVVLGLALAAAISVWHAKQTIEGALAPELAGKTQTVETIKAKIYAPTVNKRLGVPSAEKVLTATKLRPSTSPQTITAAIDETGNTRLYIRKDPLPWFGRATRQDLSLIYGQMDHETVTRLQYRVDLIQIKKINLGLSASANIGGEARALVGVSLSYSW